MLPKEAIDEFKNIYKVEFGEDLSDSEATEKATHVINLFRILCEPTDKDPKFRKDQRPNLCKTISKSLD